MCNVTGLTTLRAACTRRTTQLSAKRTMHSAGALARAVLRRAERVGVCVSGCHVLAEVKELINAAGTRRGKATTASTLSRPQKGTDTTQGDNQWMLENPPLRLQGLLLRYFYSITNFFASVRYQFGASMRITHIAKPSRIQRTAGKTTECSPLLA